MSDIDIVDQIDALVDEQLANFDNRSGYDHSVNQERCRHCHTSWHGLPRYHCPGSAAEGPMPPTAADYGLAMEARPAEFRPPSHAYADALRRQVVEFIRLRTAIDALGGTWDDSWTIEEARNAHARLALEHVVIPSVREAINAAITMFGDLAESVTAAAGSIRSGFAGLGAQLDAEPDTRTPQQRALPRSSTTPPMWANDVTRSRRPRRNRNQPNRQGIA